MLLVMMYELILLYVIGVIVDLLELLDSLELLVMLYDGIIGYVLDVFFGLIRVIFAVLLLNQNNLVYYFVVFFWSFWGYFCYG